MESQVRNLKHLRSFSVDLLYNNSKSILKLVLKLISELEFHESIGFLKLSKSTVDG